MKDKQKRQFPYGSAISTITLHFFDYKDAVKYYSSVQKKEGEPKIDIKFITKTFNNKREAKKHTWIL